MKRLFSILALAGLFVLSTNTVNAKATTTMVVSNLSTMATTVMLQDDAPSTEDKSFHAGFKRTCISKVELVL